MVAGPQVVWKSWQTERRLLLLQSSDQRFGLPCSLFTVLPNRSPPARA
jgi:hypothetical protein